MLELQAQLELQELERVELQGHKEQQEQDCKVLLVLQGKWGLLELEFKGIMAQQAQRVLELLEQAEFKAQQALLVQQAQLD
jgi:hypothetical protein